MGNVHAKAPSSSSPSDNLNNILNGYNEDARKSKEQSDMQNIDLQQIPARVDKVLIEGLSRTKDDIIEDCVKELFQAKDFQDVLLKTHVARHKLDELGCFKSIGVAIDTNNADNATQDGLKVIFDVRELKRFTGGISTHVGNNEGSVQIGLRTPNLFGRGERFQVEYNRGSKNTKNFNISYIHPLRGINRHVLKTTLLQSHAEWPSSGYKLLERGLLVDMAFNTSSLFKHNLQWEGMARDLTTLSRNASFNIREQSGLSLKSSLKYILSVDLRDDLIFPSEGSSLQLSSELAGLGGDVGFFKNELFFQDNITLFDDIIFQASLMCGCITPTDPNKKVTIADRCFLGGPLNLRGFENRGVGPHSDADSLGCSAYWALGLHLFTPLPFRPGKGGFGDLFRTHFFLNAGNVGDMSMEKVTNKDVVKVLKDNFRLSYGMGLALRLGNMARLEVNYCFPFIFDKGDQTHPGVQFGIGVQFL